MSDFEFDVHENLGYWFYDFDFRSIKSFCFFFFPSCSRNNFFVLYIWHTFVFRSDHVPRHDLSLFVIDFSFSFIFPLHLLKQNKIFFITCPCCQSNCFLFLFAGGFRVSRVLCSEFLFWIDAFFFKDVCCTKSFCHYPSPTSNTLSSQVKMWWEFKVWIFLSFVFVMIKGCYWLK